MVTRGFVGKRRGGPAGRIPPGQYVTDDFPVLSAGPTPRISLDTWTLTLTYRQQMLASWTWQQFLALPHTKLTVDIHCVTKWSKLDTVWEGVSFDTLLAAAALEPPAPYITAFCYGGYTTNLPVEDLRGDKAIVAFRYRDLPLTPEHGGPARLLVPHLYLWKSAKWLQGISFTDTNEPGFWETHGYHLYGDPWKEQRYWGD